MKKFGTNAKNVLNKWSWIMMKSDNIKLSIFSLGLIGLLVSAQQFISHKLTISEDEIFKSCKTGMLIYVLKHKENLPLFEKRKQIREIAEDCRDYAKKYMEDR